VTGDGLRTFTRIDTIAPVMKLLCLFAMVLTAGLFPSASASAADVAKPKPVLAPLPELLAKQHASEGQRLEQAGDYRRALKEYQAAIAEQPVNDLKPIAPLTDDPSPFLIRASAELDAARVMPRVPGQKPQAVAAMLSSADRHFSNVLTIVQGRPVNVANQTVTLTSKAMLGRTYVRLLSGNITMARADLESASTRPVPEAPQISGVLTGLDKRFAELPPAEKSKPEALVKLGIEVVKAFLPKYAGLAVAVGDVADAFKK
jgi:hypothetical protein